MKIKTIDIIMKSWKNRIDNNEFFSAHVIIDYNLSTEQKFKMPMQYGDIVGCLWAVRALLRDRYLIKDTIEVLPDYCQKNRIILRKIIYDNCLKKEVKEFGKL